MGTVKADNIQDAAGSGAPDFTYGHKASGQPAWHVDLNGAAHTTAANASNTDIDNWTTSSFKAFTRGSVALTASTSIVIPSGGGGLYFISASIHWDDANLSDQVLTGLLLLVSDTITMGHANRMAGASGDGPTDIVSGILNLTQTASLKVQTFVNDPSAVLSGTSVRYNYFCGARIA